MKKLEKKKHFVIESDMFDVDIACFINHSHQEMVEASKKISKTLHGFLVKINQPEDTTADMGQMYPLERGYALRLRFYKDSHRKNVGILSHEICHLVQYILRDRRIPPTVDTEEVYAYLTADLMKKFLDKW